MSLTAGSRTVSPGGISKALTDILVRFDRNNKESADKVMKEATLNMFGAVIEETPEGDFDPEHEGTLKGSWIVTRGRPSGVRTKRQMRGRTRDSIRSLISTKMFSHNVSMFLTSNSDYVRVVEYGGYPKVVSRGTFNKTTGRYEKRSAKGFSKQAPKGMVRRNTKRFKRIVTIAANKVL